MLEDLILIYNPNSGRALSNAVFDEVVSVFKKAGARVSLCAISDAHQVAWENYSAVAVIGGDGTLSGVVNMLMGAKQRPPVGYIPAGTANDVARTHGLAKDPIAAARRILEGKPAPMDIGRFGDVYFTYVAAFGAFTRASYATAGGLKHALGRPAYILSGIASVPSIKPKRCVIEYDGGVIEGEYIFGGVTNSRSLAGFVRLPPEQIDLCDGKFELVLVQKPARITRLGKLVGDILRKRYDADEIHLLHTSKATFTFEEPVAWTRDGEDGGECVQVSIAVHHGAISIIL